MLFMNSLSGVEDIGVILPSLPSEKGAGFRGWGKILALT